MESGNVVVRDREASRLHLIARRQSYSDSLVIVVSVSVTEVTQSKMPMRPVATAGIGPAIGVLQNRLVRSNVSRWVQFGPIHTVTFRLVPFRSGWLT